jgi:hypothetical protein
MEPLVDDIFGFICGSICSYSSFQAIITYCQVQGEFMDTAFFEFLESGEKIMKMMVVSIFYICPVQFSNH